MYLSLRKNMILFAQWLIKHNVSENHCFLFDVILCLFGLNFLALENYLLALLCLCLFRFSRKISVFMYRLKNHTQNFFINSTDYIFLALYLFGFTLANPEKNAIGACLLLATLLINCSTVINYNALSCFLEDFKCQNMRKYINNGLAKPNEIFYILLIMCIFQNYFLQISIFFGLMSLMKALLLFSIAFYDLEIKNRDLNKKND